MIPLTSYGSTIRHVLNRGYGSSEIHVELWYSPSISHASIVRHERRIGHFAVEKQQSARHGSVNKVMRSEIELS